MLPTAYFLTELSKKTWWYSGHATPARRRDNTKTEMIREASKQKILQVMKTANSASRIAEAAELSQSQTNRLLVELCEEGYIERTVIKRSGGLVIYSYQLTKSV